MGHEDAPGVLHVDVVGDNVFPAPDETRLGDKRPLASGGKELDGRGKGDNASSGVAVAGRAERYVSQRENGAAMG